MKKLIFLSVTIALFTISCNDKIEETYIINDPVYLSYADLRKSVSVIDEQPIQQPGKLYFKDNFIFVNEYLEGIHVVNNTDPANPQVVKFIEVPGNVDLAIKDNILFVDSYVDLVALDISDLEDIKEVKRIENAFPYILPQYDEGIVESIDHTQGVVVSWNKKTVTREVEDNGSKFLYFDSFATDAIMANGIENSGSGTGGSMARFTIYDKYLYTVNEYELKLFNIDNPVDPEFENQQYIGWRIETIFPYHEKLFIGSQSGLYIYSLSVPSSPEIISMYQHVTSCDPVVVEGDYAYVTLRAGNLCGAGESQLDVIDIREITEPKLAKAYEMTEPYGLGINDSVLFICDGSAGLKIYDASNVNTIDDNMLANYPNLNAFDVIPLDGILLVIGVDGLYQYDYSRLDSIYELSYLPVYNQ